MDDVSLSACHDQLTCHAFNTTTTHSLLQPHASLSAFEISFVAACSSFLTLLLAALFNQLKLSTKQQTSTWSAPRKPEIDRLIEDTRRSYLAAEQERRDQEQLLNLQPASLSAFPPQNRYYGIVCNAFKDFLEAIHGTERDGWYHVGDKRGVHRYKKDIHSSTFSVYRGEKVLPFASNVLIRAVRDKQIRLAVSDGQMTDCGMLECVDENCTVQFEQYKSPAPFVSAREFVYVDTIHRLHDGTVISFGTSIAHAARPQTDKYLRAHLKIGGWAFIKVPNEANQTKVVYVVRADLGGHIPSFVLNQIGADVPMTVERLNKALQRLSSEVAKFDLPLMDVLLYGPKHAPLDDDDGGDDGKDEEKADVETHRHTPMGNGLSSTSTYKFPAASESHKQRYAQILREHKDLWSSRAYLDLIPAHDPHWIERRPRLCHASVAEHEAMLDNFEIPDPPFEYRHVIEEALRLFDTWRKWPLDDAQGWTFKAQKEDLKVYSRAVDGEAVDIIRGEATMPFSTPIIAGVLVHPQHRRKWDEKIEELVRVEQCTQFSSVVYLSVKTPTIFITYRDMVALVFVYAFPDGSVLVGSRSIDHPKYAPKKTRVRASIYLSLWHIRPLYEANILHSKVTFYAHVSLGGALPSWLVNEASVDLPSGILKVRQYIDSVYGELHRPGMLRIPPWPLLKAMHIDVGWMDLQPQQQYDTLDDDNTVADDVDADAVAGVAGDVDDDGDEKCAVLLPPPHLLHRPKPSPALNTRQRTLSSGHEAVDTKSASVASSTTTTRRRPNSNIGGHHHDHHHRQQQQPSVSQSIGRVVPSPQIRSTSSPYLIKHRPTDHRLVVTRDMWLHGLRIKLWHITVKHKNGIDDAGVDDDDDDDKLSEESCHDDIDSNDSGVALRLKRHVVHTTLNARDRASYVTLGNCAVSELLNQTDPASKAHWVPTEAKTPRGIFVYKFLHAHERYYHYMGKAILQHEPKFIFDALCDPLFRFEYDQMLDEMEIVDKLDHEAYIARYLHTNRQCYIRQQRQSLTVVKHKCVAPNDKYVAAGMSVEHARFPTEIGVHCLQQMRMQSSLHTNDGEVADDDDDDDGDGDIASISKQLSGKGPSKLIHGGCLTTDIKASGWVIERNVKKPTDSIVSYIVNLNFGGSVPSALLKAIAKKQPLAIYYLGKALRDRAKKMKQQKKMMNRK